ncbi:exo-beta-N-acetylmuramidase NamZ domain-containing protein [Cellulophaga sp. Hel_I_12]|uniref:exo-beta-N-acetylmuramidase NamZ family protein n=1 Tax=Cellulophaga sp. Hel_I_12 TaxID=1249972 RepID=UPI00068A8151|nr:DUF1343 domain-containing protein [Cellulophaga sp. Hel_I_12]
MKNTKRLPSFFIVMISFLFLSSSCGQTLQKGKNSSSYSETVIEQGITKKEIIVAANQTAKYLGLFKGKNVAIVANNTSVIFRQNSENADSAHLVDSLLSLDVKIVKAFAPEHGFRGDADAGAKIKDEKDPKTNLPVTSLYGANYKPSADQLKGVDIVVFDIQDVGARFYTYLSTMHYVMEACAENNIPVVVLDRPNPNGHYIDGPVLENKFESFVGLHPVPMVYGMTIGEYAKMINGEKWLKNGIQCDLTVISLKNYTHESSYSLPLRPSPNLPNDKAINLYPSLCLFEGTNVNAGRGTETQFQVFGSPYLPRETYPFSYTPVSNFGAKSPKYVNEECYGLDLTRTVHLAEINLNWLIDAYRASDGQEQFFKYPEFFDKLAGTDSLRKQIIEGASFEEIRRGWKTGLDTFKSIRAKYLLYE